MYNPVPRYDIGERIGEGLSKGFSDTFGEFYKKGQLGQSLKSLQNQAKTGNFNTFDLATKALTTPFLSSDQANFLMPFLQTQAFASSNQPNSFAGQQVPSNQRQMTGTGGPGIQPNIPSGNDRALQSEFSQRYGFEPESLEDSASVQNALNMAPVRDEASIINRAQELIRSNPAVYPTKESAIAGAEREFESDLKRYNEALSKQERQINTRESALKNYRSTLAQKIQIGGPANYSEIPGEIQNKQENKLKSLIKQGASPESAVEKLTSQALSFAKSRNRQLNESWANPVRWIENFKTRLPTYREIGAEEVALNDAINSGLSRQQASQEVFPVTDQTRKFIDSLKIKKPNLAGAGARYGRPSDMFGRASPDQVEKLVDYYRNNLQPSDSFEALQNVLRSKEIDEKPFIQALKDAYENKELAVNERQGRELETLAPYEATLMDLWLHAWERIRGRK